MQNRGAEAVRTALDGDSKPSVGSDHLLATPLVREEEATLDKSRKGAVVGGEGRGNHPLKLLISYWYFRNVDVAEWLSQFKHPVQVFADSGAFSAHSMGQELRVEDYCDWLEKWRHLIHVYAALDVKGNYREGMRNLNVMEKRGLMSIPVYHGGEPMSVLEELLARGYRYIALGNIHFSGKSRATGAWLVECFKRAEGKAVFHGFGMTTPERLFEFPWYSVDSSSWSAGFRFGAVAIYVRDEKRVVYLRNVVREPGHREKWEKYKTDVARHGMHIYDFMHHDIRENWRYATIGAVAFALMGQHVRQTRPSVPYPSVEITNSNDVQFLAPAPWTTPPPGTHLYLAAQGLPKNEEKGTKGRAWYELDALHYLDDNLELFT